MRNDALPRVSRHVGLILQGLRVTVALFRGI